mmetsp:Transcript_164689/g.528332  ORF Transcript_164689/g.528332 Transcript_164689/m.528332 type:complete len:264 (+) Transcript_164689:287-1078(+)
MLPSPGGQDRGRSEEDLEVPRALQAPRRAAQVAAAAAQRGRWRRTDVARGPRRRRPPRLPRRGPRRPVATANVGCRLVVVIVAGAAGCGCGIRALGAGAGAGAPVPRLAAAPLGHCRWLRLEASRHHRCAGLGRGRFCRQTEVCGSGGCSWCRRRLAAHRGVRRRPEEGCRRSLPCRQRGAGFARRRRRSQDATAQASRQADPRPRRRPRRDAAAAVATARGGLGELLQGLQEAEAWPLWCRRGVPGQPGRRSLSRHIHAPVG